MGFEVRPQSLRETARALDVLSRGAGQAAGYTAHTEPRASGGSAFVRLLNSTAGVRPAAQTLFEHLERLAERSADELIATARYYDTSDQEAVVRADHTYGQVRSAPTGPR